MAGTQRLGTVTVDRQTGVVVPLLGDHTTQHPKESLCQGSVEEAPGDCQTSDSGGTMRIPSWSWNSGPALHPNKDAVGVWGTGAAAARHLVFV